VNDEKTHLPASQRPTIDSCVGFPARGGKVRVASQLFGNFISSTALQPAVDNIKFVLACSCLSPYMCVLGIKRYWQVLGNFGKF